MRSPGRPEPGRCCALGRRPPAGDAELELQGREQGESTCRWPRPPGQGAEAAQAGAAPAMAAMLPPATRPAAGDAEVELQGKRGEGGSTCRSAGGRALLARAPPHRPELLRRWPPCPCWPPPTRVPLPEMPRCCRGRGARGKADAEGSWAAAASAG